MVYALFLFLTKIHNEYQYVYTCVLIHTSWPLKSLAKIWLFRKQQVCPLACERHFYDLCACNIICSGNFYSQTNAVCETVKGDSLEMIDVRYKNRK